MEFIIAQILGVLGTLANIISMQLKKKRQILICFIFAGVLFSANYLLLGGYTVAVVCMVATLQTFVSLMFEKKEKEIPKWLIVSFFILSLIGAIVSYQSILDIFPILGGITYTWAIVQKQEKNIRLITLVNYTLWLVYDIFVKAYSTGISDGICMLSTMIGIIRLDMMKRPNKKIGKCEENV